MIYFIGPLFILIGCYKIRKQHRRLIFSPIATAEFREECTRLASRGFSYVLWGVGVTVLVLLTQMPGKR